MVKKEGDKPKEEQLDLTKEQPPAATDKAEPAPPKEQSAEPVSPEVIPPERNLPTVISPAELALASGFQGSALAATPMQGEAGAIAQVAREEAEIKAAAIIAMRNPRDEQKSYVRVVQSCKRPGFAQRAVYRFPRGGGAVEGPSVDLAREVARCWGNIRYGLRVVTETEDRVHIKGFAYDLESNNHVEMEDKFEKLIYRKRGGWQKPDERDLRELMNRRGAICMRNAILQLLPPDIVEEAVELSKETVRQAAAGEIKQDKAKTVRQLALAFSELDVTTDMINWFLGYDIGLITDKDIANLRAIYKSMRDGHTKREEHFKMRTDAPAETDGRESWSKDGAFAAGNAEGGTK